MRKDRISGDETVEAGPPHQIVFVGQTPPPYGGQAIMIQKIAEGDYTGIRLVVVRLAFSQNMSDIGRVQPGKFLHLLRVIATIVWHRLSTGATTLYYPPAGPERVPLYRDLLILLSTRWMFRRTIFHFHAGGISEFYPRMSRFMKWLFRRAYFHADVGIRMSESAPPDPAMLECKTDLVVPYGIEDAAGGLQQRGGWHSDTPRLLFVGLIRESKGITVLLDACAILAREGKSFELDVMGEFESPEFEAELREGVATAGLEDKVRWLGVLTGPEKNQAFARADIFCFPTYFESEAFPVVLIEAMQFALPIVSTYWRGVPDLVTDGLNGFLTPIRDSEAVAAKLGALLSDAKLASRFGRAGRERYEHRYTLEAFRREMHEAFNIAIEES